MTPIHPEAIKAAREMIKADLGGIADLDEELRNTIANTYYRICHLRLELDSKFASPHMIALEGDLAKGLDKFSREWALLEAGAKFLPEIIHELRDFAERGDRAAYRNSRQKTLDTFKYRIPDLPHKSPFRVSIERQCYATKVDEIPNLWRLL